MPVRPIDTNRVATYRFHGQHFERRLKHRKQIRGSRRVIGLLRLRAVRTGARGTGALVAQISKGIVAVVPVFPIDLDASGLGDGNVFGFVDRCTHNKISKTFTKD